MAMHDQGFTRNCILSSLSGDDFRILQPDLVRVDLAAGQVLSQPGLPIEHIYFLEGGVASLVTIFAGRKETEVGLFGREGLCGVAAILRAGQTAATARMRIDHATALRMPAAALIAACRRSDTLLAMLLRYVQTTIVQTAQTAATNANCTLPQRLARWLLMCHDRVDGDDIAVTHEFIAGMLAVDRSGLTITLHTLEATGAVRSRRGVVTINDRALLEEIASDAYGQPEDEYRRLIGPFVRARVERR